MTRIALIGAPLRTVVTLTKRVVEFVAASLARLPSRDKADPFSSNLIACSLPNPSFAGHHLEAVPDRGPKGRVFADPIMHHLSIDIQKSRRKR